MAITRMNSGDHTWSSASWNTVAAAASSENDSEAASATPPTAGGATSDSGTFTPGAVTIDGIALKIAQRAASPTGTITVLLRTGGADVAGTTVTINVADLPAIGTTNTPSGWFFFKLSTPKLLVTATAYLIRVTTTSASQVVLYSSSGNDWARMLRTTTTGSMAVNDRAVIVGEYTSAGVSVARTVTYDGTAATIWGSAVGANSLNVCSLGTLQLQTTASTTYILNLLGLFNCYINSTVNLGTAGTALPSTSSFTLTFQNAANVDCGWEIRAGATVNLQGATVTTTQTKLTGSLGGLCSTVGTAVTGLEGQSFVGLTGTITINGSPFTISSVTDATHLTLTGSAGTLNVVPWVHAGSDNVLPVGADTSWANGGVLAVASTSRTASDCEKVTISSIASLNVTTTAAVANPHLGGVTYAGTDMSAEVAYLTRNVKVQGISTTFQAYVNIAATAIVTWRYAEFTQLGSATANKRGIDVATTTGTFDAQFCSLHDFIVLNSFGVNVSSASGSGITFSSNVLYNIYNQFFANVATTGVQTVSGNLCILTTTSVVSLIGFSLGDAGSTYTNNTVVGVASNAAQTAIALSEATGTIGTFSGNVVHGCNGLGFSVTVTGGTVGSCTAWRNAIGFAFGINRGPAVVSGLTAFGHSSYNVSIEAQAAGSLYTGCTLNAGANLTCPTGVAFRNGLAGFVYFDSCSFGSTNAHSTGDLVVSTVGIAIAALLYNCLLASTTELSGQSSMALGSFIRSQKHDQTAGLHKTWKAEGTASIDTSIFDVTPSARLTPLSASLKLETGAPGQQMRVPVANGATVTFSVKVRKSAAGDGTAYNGSQPRLIVKKNVAMGIATDTVLQSASGAAGSFETLSGTTAAVTDDGALDFVVDCDGTLGWVNVDTATAS